MKPVNLKITIILSSIIGATLITQNLCSADISKYHASSTRDSSSRSAAGRHYGPRPGTRAYYREMGCNDSGTPSQANLIEQTAELHAFLAATSTLFVTPKSKHVEKKLVVYDRLLTAVPYKSDPHAGGTTINRLEVPADFFSNYCAIALDKRNSERDFVPEDPDSSINPYSDQYRFLTTGHHYSTYLPATTSTIDSAIIDTLTTQFKATGITAAPPFSKAWLKDIRTKSSVIGTIADPVALPLTQSHRSVPPPIPPTKPLPPPLKSTTVTVTEHPRRHELATAANVMSRLAEFKKLKSLWVRRRDSSAKLTRKR